MLIIRPKQSEAFQPTAEAAFVRRVVDYIRENHSDQVLELPSGSHTVRELSDETIHKMVRNGVARAREYGMSWESSLTAFVMLMIIVAPNFDGHPLIRRVLKAENIDPDTRIERLWEQTSEENWEAAKENYDASAWNLDTEER